MNGELVPRDADERQTEVGQGSDDGDARDVDQIPVVREEVQVGADGPAALAGDQTQRFDVERTAPADGFLDETGKQHLDLRGSANTRISFDEEDTRSRVTDRPTSKTGEAIGPISVDIVNNPS